MVNISTASVFEGDARNVSSPPIWLVDTSTSQGWNKSYYLISYLTVNASSSQISPFLPLSLTYLITLNPLYLLPKFLSLFPFYISISLFPLWHENTIMSLLCSQFFTGSHYLTEVEIQALSVIYWAPLSFIPCLPMLLHVLPFLHYLI